MKSSNRIREFREKAGLSQRELAAAVGCSAGYIAQLETSDDKRPGIDIARALARALKTTDAKLFPEIGSVRGVA